MMKKSGFLAAMLAGLAMVMAPQMAMARSIPGNAMLPDTNPRSSQWNCIGQEYTAAINICSTNQTFFLPLVLDNAGSKTVSVTAYGPSSSSNVGCTAYAWHAGGSFSSSNTGYLPAFGSWQTITLTGASVVSNGSMYVVCSVGPSAFVDVVNYNP